MNTAAVSVISAPSPPSLNRIKNTSAFLRKLSLNAEKNWHQNRGAKRRVSSRDEDMGCIRSIDRARWPMWRAILERGRQKWKPDRREHFRKDGGRFPSENATAQKSSRAAARRLDGAPGSWPPQRPSECRHG